MEFSELIQQRKSVRSFLDQPISPDILEQILKAANLAPSAGNLQAFEIFITTSSEKKAQLTQAALDQEFIHEAPVVLVFCTNSSRSEWKYKQRAVNLYAVQDATIACTYAMLAATNLGLGCVWVGAFNDEKVAEALGNPPGLRPVAMLPVGYPARNPNPRPRRPLEDLVHTIED
jgi:nitroreductase